MQIAAASSTTSAAAASPAAKHAPPHPSAFHQFLSELNPLQYLPVVGTLYRAITGDTIPETARMAGSLVVSGLTGGPIGIAMNVGMTALEHVLGIDPEKMGTHLLASLGIGGHAAATQVAAASASDAATGASTATAQGWSAAQLMAYGVSNAGGQLARGTLSGADVLNSLELARIGAPSSTNAYA